MTAWKDDACNQQVPLNTAVKSRRVVQGLTAQIHLLDAFDELTRSLKEKNVSRDDLLDEALDDLLIKYSANLS